MNVENLEDCSKDQLIKRIHILENMNNHCNEYIVQLENYQHNLLQIIKTYEILFRKEEEE